MTSTRRHKILWIQPEHIIAILRPTAGLQYGGLENIPQDASIESIFVDHSRRSFGLVVSHPSFDEVDPCMIPPSVPTQVTAHPCVSVAAIEQAIAPFRKQIFPDECARAFDSDSHEAGIAAVLCAIAGVLHTSATLAQG